MPRVAVKVAEAPSKTHWTLSQKSDQPIFASSQIKDAAIFEEKMQANGHYYVDQEPPLPRYESYDGSQYSVAQSFGARTSGMSGVVNGAVPHGYEDYTYSAPADRRTSHQMSLHTRMRSHNTQDAVGHHLLFETAMFDSQSFEVLDIAAVDALKKEHERLNARIEAANRKLTLETKVKDAAQNLQRLYSVKNRPDTPQSPDSARQSRSSLLGHRDRLGNQKSGPGTAHQAADELTTSMKKVDELNETIKSLLDRRQYVERKLLRHTAAVLAEQSTRASQQISGTALTNGAHMVSDHENEDDAINSYSPDEFDGIREILSNGGAISGSQLSKKGGLRKMQQGHEQQLASVQNRLEQLNDQLRHVIGEASRTLGQDPEPELDLHDDDDDPNLRLDKRFSRLESNLRLLEQDQRDVNTHYLQMQNTRDAVEEQLEGLNRQVHNTLLLCSDMQNMESLREVPPASGQGYQQQFQYLEESLLAMEQLLKQHRSDLDKTGSYMKKIGEYEATMSGLWEILQSDPRSHRPSMTGVDTVDQQGFPGPTSPLREDFSLQAFNAHVQHLFSRVQASQQQQDILRRQIQQQRELNGKSDAEKDRQLTELQTAHDQLSQEHSLAQEELTKTMASHTQAEEQASQAKLELVNVMNEFEQLKRTIEEKEATEKRHADTQADVQAELQNLESEVVRLTTELTMAKAELEGAYGSRAERAREAQAAEASERTKQLEKELGEMTNDFQDLMKESLGLEKERAQLEDLIDGLRERCDTLEAQLGDEKVRWLGVKSPGGVSDAGGREMTSTMVLRQEFKKMMRETRAEGMKLLRVSLVISSALDSS